MPSPSKNHTLYRVWDPDSTIFVGSGKKNTQIRKGFGFVLSRKIKNWKFLFSSCQFQPIPVIQFFKCVLWKAHTSGYIDFLSSRVVNLLKSLIHCIEWTNLYYNSYAAKAT